MGLHWLFSGELESWRSESGPVCRVPSPLDARKLHRSSDLRIAWEYY